MQVTANDLLSYANMTQEQRTTAGLPQAAVYFTCAVWGDMSQEQKEAWSYESGFTSIPFITEQRVVYIRNTLDPTLTKEKAEEFVQNLMQVQLSAWHPKINRPWDFVPLHASLDPEQTWIGWEWETGFRSPDMTNEEAHRHVMQHLWDEYDYIAVDGEGIGEFPCEITMPPQNMSEYEAGTAYFQRLLRYLGSQNITQHGTDSGVGTHANISTSTIRESSTGDVSRAIKVINSAIMNMPEHMLYRLFNRYPYGHGYLRTNAGQKWIEWKLFMSVSDPDVVQQYINTASRLADAVDLVINNNITAVGPSELYEFLLNESETL